MKKICGNCQHFKTKNLTCLAAMGKTVCTKKKAGGLPDVEKKPPTRARIDGF